MLTRYLYKKSDVENALVAALLYPKSVNGKGDNEPALFWAYELYYSGFIGQLIELLWRVYYDFYVVAYVCLEPHFKEYLQSEEYLRNNPKVVGIIIRNLLHKRPTLDVFLYMRGYCNAVADDINDIIAKISSADLSKHHELDAVLEAVAKYVIVADEYIADFKKDIMGYPLLSVLGMKRILFATCASYKYMVMCENDEDDPQVILKLFKNLSQYKTVTCSKGFNVLAMAACEDLRNHKDGIAFVYNGGNCTGNATINHTPFWQDKIVAYGGQLTAAGLLWEDDDEQAAFDLECDYDIEEQPAEIQMMRQCSVVEPMTQLQIQDFIDTYYSHWENIKPIIRVIKPIAMTTGQKLLPLEFAAVESRVEHPLKRRVFEILAEAHKEYLCGWYLQIMDRFELTEESLAGVNYKGLKRFARTGIPNNAMPCGRAT